MTVEQAIREAANKGRLSITLFATSSGKYQASVAQKQSNSWRVEMHDDPVTALEKALGLAIAAPEPDGGVFG